jgi:hypothetical protein
MSQGQLILRYLKFGRRLTPLAALKLFGCLRLAARIHDLRRQGHTIQSGIIWANGKRFACYSMPAKTESK